GTSGAVTFRYTDAAPAQRTSPARRAAPTTTPGPRGPASGLGMPESGVRPLALSSLGALLAGALLLALTRNPPWGRQPSGRHRPTS
ncbi:MAG: hypothetical protein M3071_20760, partial [Actinomycetota bacterium]|nr:hypothetical protein [Actinomycetota bacterium]